MGETNNSLVPRLTQAMENYLLSIYVVQELSLIHISEPTRPY